MNMCSKFLKRTLVHMSCKRVECLERVYVINVFSTCARIEFLEYVCTYLGNSIRTHVFRILNTCGRIECPEYVYTY